MPLRAFLFFPFLQGLVFDRRAFRVVLDAVYACFAGRERRVLFRTDCDDSVVERVEFVNKVAFVGPLDNEFAVVDAVVTRFDNLFFDFRFLGHGFCFICFCGSFRCFFAFGFCRFVFGFAFQHFFILLRRFFIGFLFRCRFCCLCRFFNLFRFFRLGFGCRCGLFLYCLFFLWHGNHRIAPDIAVVRRALDCGGCRFLFGCGFFLGSGSGLGCGFFFRDGFCRGSFFNIVFLGSGSRFFCRGCFDNRLSVGHEYRQYQLGRNFRLGQGNRLFRNRFFHCGCGFFHGFFGSRHWLFNQRLNFLFRYCYGSLNGFFRLNCFGRRNNGFGFAVHVVNEHAYGRGVVVFFDFAVEKNYLVVVIQIIRHNSSSEDKSYLS